MHSPQALAHNRLKALPIRAAVGIALMAFAALAISSSSLESVVLVAVGAGTVLLVLRWPWLIWLTSALLLPIASAYRFGAVSGTEIILLAATGLWLLDGARRRSLQVYPHPIVLLPLIYAGVQLISLLGDASLREGVPEVVKWVEFALVLALMPAMTPPKAAIWIAAAAVAGATAQAAIGLYQFFYQIGPEWFVLFGRFMRASGTFRQPNPYAAYLGVLLPVAVSLAIWSWIGLARRRFDGLGGWTWAAFFASASLIITAGILASWSRGGWLAAGASLLVVVAVRNRKALVAVLIGGAGAVIAFVGASPPRLTPEIQSRLQGVYDLLRPAGLLNAPVTDDNFALIERLAHWVAGYRMWESAPWLGVGAGNYAAVYDQVRLPVWTEPLGHAHNLYLNVLAETGVVGMVAFLTMWIGLAVWAWNQLEAPKRMCEDWSGAMAAAVLGAMVYLTIHSIVDVLFVQGIYLALALPIAVLASGCNAKVTE